MKSNQQTQFRRHRQGNGWCTSDHDHIWFDGGFNTALVENVTFNHDAPPMSCESGYDSTGEATGVIEIRDMPVSMPAVAVNSEKIVYDRRRRRFHVLGQFRQKVDSADFLVLDADGNAEAGWKANSKCAPAWLRAREMAVA